MQASPFQRRRLDGGLSSRPQRPSGAARAGRHGRLGGFFRGIVRVTGMVFGGMPRGSRGYRRLLFRLVLVGSVIGVLYVGVILLFMPDISDPKNMFASQSTVIVDRNGIELYRLHGEQDRTYVEGEQIPDSIRNAVVAIEDERFYDRGCLDLLSIARVIFRFGQAGGGSTITRQLARNALDLKGDLLLNRKLKELVLGCQLEQRYSKNELLELYLNWIPFGQNAYGIEQASRTYFGISASELNLAQSAVLAALPQRPSYLSPYGLHVHTQVLPNIEHAILQGRITKTSQIGDSEVTVGLLGAYAGTGSTTVYVGGRTDQVLRNMQNQNLITEQERLATLEELESIAFEPAREDIRAPHFVLSIRDQVEQLLGQGAEEGILEKGGLRIETTLDWDLQQSAEDVVAFHYEDLLNRYGATNMALLSVDRDTREVLAYVGNMNFADEEHGGKIDMVQVPRQPGSSFKPFVYASAFQKGYTPATVLYDVQTKIGDDEPQNFDGGFWGPLTVRYALGASRNIPAAKAYFLAGQEAEILALITEMGAPSPLRRKEELSAERGEQFDYGWPLALGAAETPLYEMVQGYSTFADSGTYKPLISIRRITDRSGNLLYEAEQKSKEVLDPRIAYQITSILSDEQARPEGYWRTQLSIPGFQTAAKTGTSNKCLERDEKTGDCKLLKPDNGWVLGYTPNIVTGVWVGNADSSAMFDRAGGLNTASPIWHDYMLRAHRRLETPITQFPVPSGVVQVQVSLLSGQLPTDCTPVALRRPEVFLEENVPTQSDSACAQLEIDRVTGLLASNSCPVSARASGSFIIAHSLLPDRWPQWEEGVQKWVGEQMAKWNADPTHSGSILPLPVAPAEECDPSKTPGRLVEPELTIVAPGNGGTASYPSFRPRITFSVGSTVHDISYEIDGRRVARATEAPFDPALTAPRSVSKEGTHTLTVTLTDAYFNTVEQTVSFQFGDDTIPPAVNILSPSAGASVARGAELTVRAEATDTSGAIKYVQFYLDDILLSTKPVEPYRLTYTINAEPGVHTLRAEAEDMAGNRSSDSVEVTVE